MFSSMNPQYSKKLSITDSFFFFFFKEQQPVLALLQPAKVVMRSINNGGQAIFEKPTTFTEP